MYLHFYPSLALLSCLISFDLLAIEVTHLSRSELNQLTPEEQLGQQIFFDTNLSSPAGQACASCHDPKVAFSDPAIDRPVSSGVLPDRLGIRNTPAITYATFSPDFHFDAQEGLYVGGNFLDGRASNASMQAKQPFLNPDEMNNVNSEEVVAKLRQASYIELFKQVYGQDALKKNDTAFDLMASALVAFEKSKIFNRFTSKYDYYLAGKVKLSPLEKQGLDLFNDEEKGNCAACHPSELKNNAPPLFTDFTYDNLGTPANPEILTYKGPNFVDLGLGGIVNQSIQNGKFKVPSLRNAAKTAPYMHNGVFKTLQEVVDFYNTRDILVKWDKPEVTENKNIEELGYLKLKPTEAKAITAFLETLTDGYRNDLPSYSSVTKILELPLVTIEQSSVNSVAVRARLQEVTNNGKLYFRLVSVAANESVNDIAESLPYYSDASNLLELPVVTVDEKAHYVAQLKRVKDDEGYLFELIYCKMLQ